MLFPLLLKNNMVEMELLVEELVMAWLPSEWMETMFLQFIMLPRLLVLIVLKKIKY